MALPRGLEVIPLRISLHPETKKPTYELRFASLRREGATITVPCSENGVVDLDQLEDEARDAYLYAHMLVGLEFAKPVMSCAGEEPE